MNKKQAGYMLIVTLVLMVTMSSLMLLSYVGTPKQIEVFAEKSGEGRLLYTYEGTYELIDVAPGLIIAIGLLFVVGYTTYKEINKKGC